MYITFDSNTKRVHYIGEKKPVSYSDNLTLAEVDSLPSDYDYLTVTNEREQIEHYTEKEVVFNEETGEAKDVVVQKERRYLACSLVAQFEEKTPERIERENRQKYEKLVEVLIRKKYSISQELAILRQRDTKPDEFEAYNAYAEECKVVARQKIGGAV